MVNAEQLIKLLDFNLLNKHYNNAVKLLDEEQYSQIILSHYSDVIQDVILKHLTSENYANEPTLYGICESIIKLLAEKCHQQGILFEFLEIIETVKDDDVFTSILKGLQVIILNQSERQSRALEYCLNSIEDYILDLPIPSNLLKNIEEEEGKILENDEQVRRVLLMYMILEKFYEPIVKQIVESKPLDKIFRSRKFNRHNVLFCFILRLLGKPLSFLDLSHDETTNKVKTYSRQVAEDLVNTLCQLHVDVFQLLSYVETRCRWPTKDKIDDDLNDIFLHHEKTPLLQLGMLFYLIIGEGIQSHQFPKIYNPTYIFQMGIYLVNVMITSDDEPIVFKGLKLAQKMIDNITSKLNSDELDIEIHRTFCNSLVKLLMYSPSKRNRQRGLQLLRCYILKFDIEGRYLLIKNILKISDHKGLMGYLTTMYKDIIFEEINTGKLSEYTSGQCLKQIVLEHTCKLNGGVQCDIADSSDQIHSSLNFLRAIFIRDKENVTGVKHLIADLQNGFLSELRSALDLSRAHYHAEIENVKAGKSSDMNEIIQGTEILNDVSEPLNELTNERKLDMLHSALSIFNLIDFQLAAANEVINQVAFTQ
ncbi:CLUMA_CG002126, isoform A [Clunio marinus]|uniref:CLUMA_CG002126, isoform A n=1 Tax=Clunio marinus TaxID=568069 RepID=A0A1J1HLR3_9DIPT|nr:CLUMA_CG002126, isoform A [Clunio marinus]